MQLNNKNPQDMLIEEKNKNTVYSAGSIAYEILSSERLEETIRFVTEHFVEHEYLTRESGLDYASFERFSRLYCQASLCHRLSIIAVDTEINEVIGFAINEDPNSPMAVDASIFYDISVNFHPFLEMLTELSARYLTIPSQEKMSFHLYLLGVKPQYQGKGIGKALVELSEIRARQKGFRYIVIEATSPPTKPICERLNYTNLGHVSYRDFTLDGEKPYEHIIDYEGPYLFIKAFDDVDS
ncbi:GNAT family N-acetyltransferase [Fangia hongkongensis]|uniref:GNAT family N-acetyltransferase n=1 Tax=Fangia hongkongensis TaxID=270495 RepID=UPI000382EA59|nr:GNAT family N-acetyltransferase [Fangia hongkongensis]